MPDRRYIWLLINKLASIGIRPLAVIVEAYFVDAYEHRLLPIVIPASMLVMATVSVPVHRDFYQSVRNDARNLYLGSLSALLLISVIFTSLYYYLFLVKSEGVLICVVTCGIVISDKVADEVNRYLEYKKKYFECVIVQLARNCWLCAYCIVLVWSGQGFGTLIVILMGFQLTISFFMLMKVFKVNYRNLLCLSRMHLYLIIINSPYVINGVLPSWLLNTARLSVSIGFPEYGSIFLFATQVASIFPLVIDMAYISRRRKLMAYKSKLYSKFILPIVMNIYITTNFILILSMVIYKSGFLGGVPLLISFAIFLVVMSSLTAIFSEVLFWSLMRIKYFYMVGGIFLFIGTISTLLEYSADIEIFQILFDSALLFNIYFLMLYTNVRLRDSK